MRGKTSKGWGAPAAPIPPPAPEPLTGAGRVGGPGGCTDGPKIGRSDGAEE